MVLTGGEVSDVKGYGPVMAEPGPEPKVMLADKGYDADAILADLEDRGIAAVIPPKRNRKVQPVIDGWIYALRNLVERCFSKSSTAADWPPDTTRPQTAISASYSSHPSAYGSGTSSTEPSDPGQELCAEMFAHEASDFQISSPPTADARPSSVRREHHRGLTSDGRPRHAEVAQKGRSHRNEEAAVANGHPPAE